MDYIANIIDRYKRFRSMAALEKRYKAQYALVGIGNHCVNNLLPVMHYLQLPLKYICCTSKSKADLISAKYQGVKGTADLQEVLEDESVKGVFVVANPHSHFTLASKVLQAGKALFIEKPPCQDGHELKSLGEMAKLNGSQPIVVGLQRRFAPATSILKKRLSKENVLHYHYRYLTGLYPEGDALLDLFIHPLDYVGFLMGEAIVKSVYSVKSNKGGLTIFLTLQHQHTLGMLELSTDYSWQQAKEELSISTDKGGYLLNGMESLKFLPRCTSLLGVPLEKILQRNEPTHDLYGRNTLVPTIANNQIYAQGFFSEVETFADMVEKRRKSHPNYGLESMTHLYSLLSTIRKKLGKS